MQITETRISLVSRSNSRLRAYASGHLMMYLL